MSYPLSKVLEILTRPKDTDDIRQNERYEQLLNELLAFEEQDEQWQQTSHETLPATAGGAVRRSRVRNDKDAKPTLGLGDTLFYLVRHPSGYKAEITLTRPLNSATLELSGEILLTPVELQSAWTGSTILLYQGEFLIDSTSIDGKGVFRLKLIEKNTEKMRLTVQLRSGESISIDDLTLGAS